MNARRLVPLALALAVAAGCAPTGGTAFVVDGTNVSDKTIDANSADCLPLVVASQQQYTPEGVRESVANMMFLGTVADKIAAKRGISITDQQLAAVAQQTNETAFRDGRGCQTAVDGALRWALIANQLGLATATKDFQAMSVQVNPEYGRFDRNQVSLGTGSGSLSTTGDGNTTIGG